MKKPVAWMTRNHVAANQLMVFVLLTGALSIAEFSFFGSPKDHMDIFGPASNLGYGRIDSRMNAVSPKMGSLSAIGGLKTQLALTFVSQAFNDFRNNLVSQGRKKGKKWRSRRQRVSKVT